MAEALNLLNLARSAREPVKVPGGDFEVQFIGEKAKLALNRPLWLLVLDGELIVDLPYGDFHTLKRGDSVRLEPDSVSWQPLDEAVVLRKTL